MRFIVYGAGAIGSTVGGHLFRAGQDVALVGSPAHVDKINSDGLRLVTPEETYVFRIPAFKKAEELAPFRDGDVVLLTAKSQHTVLCLGQLKNAGATRETPILCVQNSISNEPTATRVFDHVYGVVVNLPGIFLHPGEVVNPITGNRGFLEVGVYPYGVDKLAREVSSAFRVAGFSGGVNEHVMRAKAAKCLMNLGNSMDAITDGRGEGRTYLAAARREAEEVWRKAGIEWEDLEEYRRRVREVRGTDSMPQGYEGESKRSSSWQSLSRGAGSIEAEALNGDVVKLARGLGVEAPYNEVLWRVAEDMAARVDKPGKYSAEDLAKMVEERRHKT